MLSLLRLMQKSKSSNCCLSQRDGSTAESDHHSDAAQIHMIACTVSQDCSEWHFHIQKLLQGTHKWSRSRRSALRHGSLKFLTRNSHLYCAKKPPPEHTQSTFDVKVSPVMTNNQNKVFTRITIGLTISIIHPSQMEGNFDPNDQYSESFT